MSKSLKTLLGFGLLGFIGVWIGCSSDTSPVAPQAAGKTQQISDPAVPEDEATTYVTFADSSLERAVGEALVGAFIFPQVPTRGSITVANMRRLTKLEANSRSITSLTGLGYATNLDTLNLRENSITDVSPLSSLTNLEWLDLRDNSISDLRPLSSLTNLELLDLRGNRISDISPLAGLTGLKSLNLYQNSISNISPSGLDPLAALTNLESLAIGSNYSLDGDIGPLASLTRLKNLRINGVGLRDSGLKTLAHALTDLKHLAISSNPLLTDFEPLTCLTKLTGLELKGGGRVAKRLFMKNAEGNIVLKPEHIHLLYLEKRGVTIYTKPPTWDGWSTL